MIVLKQLPKVKGLASVVVLRWLPNVEIKRFGTGHIRVDASVTTGGKTKLNGIVIGKINSPKSGRKWFTMLLMVRNISLI